MDASDWFRELVEKLDLDQDNVVRGAAKTVILAGAGIACVELTREVLDLLSSHDLALILPGIGGGDWTGTSGTATEMSSLSSSSSASGVLYVVSPVEGPGSVVGSSSPVT